MSRIRNANGFLIKFVEIREAYESTFAPLLADLRSRFAAKLQWQAVEPELEFHRRCYIINALLAALNWRLDVAPRDGLPNLIPEQPISSADTGRVRFLDYLGIDRETQRPLLIVEAKREIELPSLAGHRSGSLTAAMVLSRGLKGEKLRGEWSTWLNTTTDYVRSIAAQGGAPPNRVVLTDGPVLFAFLDPSDAFIAGGTCSPDRILVRDLRTLDEASAGELFGALDYDVVSGTARPLVPGQILFSLDAKSIDRAMHGLTLVYERVGRVFHPSPIVTISPILFIGSRYGSWTTVDGPSKDVELPRQSDELNGHLRDITRMGQDLLA